MTTKTEKKTEKFNVEMVAIDSVIPYEKNAKKHPKKQVQQIADSISAFGFNQPVVVDLKNVIIVGHGRYEAAKKLNMARVPVLKISLSEEQAKAYRLADNKLNESEWEMELVIEELKELSMPLFRLTGFDMDLIVDPAEKDDILPEKVTPRTKVGDVWELGEHRIICGDSLDPVVLGKLLDGKKADMAFTDPPYNVNYQGAGGSKRAGIKNDKMSTADFKKFLGLAFLNLVSYTDGGIYICMSPKELGSAKQAYEEAGGHWQSTVIWVKNNFVLGGADYQNSYEPILYGWREGLKKHFFVDNRKVANVWEELQSVKSEYDGQFTTISFQGFKVKLPGKIEKGSIIRKKQRLDIFRHDKPSRSDMHPTTKPVSLVSEAISNSSVEGGMVLDPFIGSGTTIIACEKMGRTCYGCELDPHYVDTAVARWEEFTKLKAKKL